MRDWFLTLDIADLFGFLYWQRDRAMGAAANRTTAQFLDPAHTVYRDMRSTLVHELDVERSWRLRLQGVAREDWDVTLDPLEFPDVAALSDAWRREEADTRSWLADLPEGALKAPVTLNGLEGYPLSACLVHVVMHGIESLSAVAILLQRAGPSMGHVGYLDYMDAVRLRGSTAPARRPRPDDLGSAAPARRPRLDGPGRTSRDQPGPAGTSRDQPGPAVKRRTFLPVLPPREARS